MPRRLAVLVAGLTGGLGSIGATQDTQPPVATADTRYLDFSEGTWYHLVDGRIDTAGTWFQV
jgi:hypothetical protein